MVWSKNYKYILFIEEQKLTSYPLDFLFPFIKYIDCKLQILESITHLY